jgi:hypothetical protein
VVGVRVSEKNGVQPLEDDPQGLLAEIGRGIDQDVPPEVSDQDGRAQPLVARVS